MTDLPTPPGGDRTTDAARDLIAAVARRVAIARSMAGDAETALLQSVVDAAAALFDSEAASIALFEPDPARLEYRVAAGAQGAGVVGLSVAPTQGIAGYVYSTGQPIALSDVRSDPRFDQGAAQRTGYVPRSIAAVPLVDDGATVGVLQVLDKRVHAHVHAPGHGAARGLRAPGGGRHRGQQGPARHGPAAPERARARSPTTAHRRPGGRAGPGRDRRRSTRTRTTGSGGWSRCSAGLRDMGERELGLVIEILRVVARPQPAAGRRRRG